MAKKKAKSKAKAKEVETTGSEVEIDLEKVLKNFDPGDDWIAVIKVTNDQTKQRAVQDLGQAMQKLSQEDLIELVTVRNDLQEDLDKCYASILKSQFEDDIHKGVKVMRERNLKLIEMATLMLNAIADKKDPAWAESNKEKVEEATAD